MNRKELERAWAIVNVGEAFLTSGFPYQLDPAWDTEIEQIANSRDAQLPEQLKTRAQTLVGQIQTMRAQNMPRTWGKAMTR